ncbi:MAG TPA: GntR family transcriptional regulator [Acidisarcina sp.]
MALLSADTAAEHPSRDEPGKTRAQNQSAPSRGESQNQPQASVFSPVSVPKYKQVYEDLLAAINTGIYQPGERLPSEAELRQRYSTSRITVAKALNDLQAQGLLSRRAGSGTHVLPRSSSSSHSFGLLIPDLGRTEIFEPICQGMMQSPLARSHSLLWGHSMGENSQQEKEAVELCQHYITQKTAGVFFAPLEFTPARDAINQRIISDLDRAGIPVVLLDRCYAPYPMRSRHDLVGIDNRRAGYLLTQHLIAHGARRIAFVARPLSAVTVTARVAGYREALYSLGNCREDLVRRGNLDDPAFLDSVIDECRPDAIVCANDLTAARIMCGLARKGIKVPEQVRIVGLDDVKYAAMLPVPLTTQHQDCNQIGSMAMITMLQRLQRPDMPIRDVLLQTHTVVRSSCGAHLAESRN